MSQLAENQLHGNWVLIGINLMFIPNIIMLHFCRYQTLLWSRHAVPCTRCCEKRTRTTTRWAWTRPQCPLATCHSSSTSRRMCSGTAPSPWWAHSLSSFTCWIQTRLMPIPVHFVLKMGFSWHRCGSRGGGPGGPGPPWPPILRPKFLPAPRLRCAMSAKSRLAPPYTNPGSAPVTVNILFIKINLLKH